MYEWWILNGFIQNWLSEDIPSMRQSAMAAMTHVVCMGVESSEGRMS